jgi:hypothetical protein
MPDVVYSAILGGTTVKQIASSSFNENIAILAARTSGSGVIADQFIDQISPMGEITTTDIANFLAAFGVSGSQITDGSTVKIPYQKRANGSTFGGAGTNMMIKGKADNPVQLVPQSVTAPRQGAVTASGQVHFLSSDGLTMPHDVLTAQDLTAETFNSMYRLGPVYINGTQLPKGVGFTVNFGVGLSEKQHFDGATYPTEVYKETFDPYIEITAEDFDILDTISGGLAITDVRAFLLKRASGSTIAAYGSAVHTKFSFATGLVTPQQISASDTKHGQAAIRFSGRTLVVSTSSAVAGA